MAKLTDLPDTLTSPASGDLMHIVDISDTTQDPAGSSKKITASTLVQTLGTSNLTEGQVPKASSSNTFVYGNATVDPTTLQWTFDETIIVPPGSLFLGTDGSEISSGGDVMNYTTAAGNTRFMVGVEYDNTGTQIPFYWELQGEQDTIISSVATDDLVAPQDFTYSINNDSYYCALKVTPHETGDLRIEAYLGTNDTGPQILDFTNTITGGEVGTQKTITLPNKFLYENGTQIYFRFSNVGLRGGLQTAGPLIGQTVVAMTVTEQDANERDYVVQNIDIVNIQSSGAFGEARLNFRDDTGTLKSSFFYDQGADFFCLDMFDINMDFRSNIPDTTALIQWITTGTNGTTVPFHFGIQDPEGVVTANQGAVYFRATGVDDTSGIFLKEAGTGNTGWEEFVHTDSGVQGPATSVLNSLATWQDTTGDTLSSQANTTLTDDGTTNELIVQSPSVSGLPRLSLFDSASASQLSIAYLESSDDLEFQVATPTLEFTSSDTTYTFQSSGLSNNLTLDFNASPDTNPILLLQAGGVNGADVNVHVGDQNPNTTVTGDPGALYIRRDGTASTAYIHADTVTSNVNWVNLISAGAGDVNGPGVTVATNSMAVFSDTTGTNIASVDQIRAERVATTTRLELLTEAAGSSRLAFTPTTGGSASFISYSDTSNTFQFINTVGRIVSAALADDIVLEAAATSQVIIENPGANTNAPLQLSVSGTDGATVNIYSSLVDPNGVITANQGDFCFVATGVNNTSAIWIKEVGTGNTGWENILSDSTNFIVGPNSSTLTGIPTFDTTLGNSVQDNPLLRYISSSTTSTLTIQESASGTADLIFAGTGGTPLGLIQSLGANLQVEAIGVGGNLNLSGLGGVSIESFNGDVTIEDVFVIGNNAGVSSATLTPPSGTGTANFGIDDTSAANKFFVNYIETTDRIVFNIRDTFSYNNGPTINQMRFDLDGASANEASIVFVDSLSVTQFQIECDGNSTQNSIISTGYDLQIVSDNAFVLEADGSDFVRILSPDGGNVVQMLQLDNNGSGGAEVNIYTSLVAPNGIITANQGDLCFVATGVDNTSAVWIKETGSATNTGWQNLHSVTSGVAGPPSSTVGALPTWDVTDGSSIQDNPLLTYTSTASTSTLSLQEAATGSADFFFNGGGGSGIGLIQTLGSTFELTSINSNNLTLSSANDLTISSLFGATTMTSGGGTLRVQTTGAHAAIFEASGSGTVDLNANAGFISLINNHGEIVMGSTAIATVTGTGVNYDVTATSANINLAADNTITLQTITNSEVVAIVGGGGDTFPIARYTTNGTGGGVFDLHVGDSTPQGRVSGANTLFFQTGAASSGNARIHYQDTDATVTNWNVLTSIGSGDTQAAGTFMHFPGTDLAQGTPTIRMRYFETGANTDIEMDSGANGAAAFRIKDELSNDRFTFIYNDSVPQATISTVGPVPLNIFASGNLDVTATGTAEITSAQSMTIETTAASADITIDAGDDMIVNANDDMTFFCNDAMNFSCGGLYTSNAFTRFDYICGQFGTLPIINFANNNTQFNLFAYFQTPIGNVTGEAGDVLVRNEGADSNVYIHKNNTPNNTDWRAMDAPAIQTWGDASIASTTATRYLTPGYDSGTAPTNAVAYRVPRDGVIQNMYIRCRTAGGNGNNVVYTLRVNSIGTALAVTLASNVQDGSNTINRINVTQGDLIDIEVTKAASIGTSPTDVMASLEIV